MSLSHTLPSVLAIGGSDCSGGGGIQTDIRAISSMGAHPATAITAVTVQNRKSFAAANPLSPMLVQEQIHIICDDLFPSAVKIGMLAESEIIQAVARTIVERKLSNIVLDPVMVSSSGGRLLKEEALDALTGELLGLCDIITPNIPEAEFLTQMSLKSGRDMQLAAGKLQAMGPRCVIIKGGHSSGSNSNDLVLLEDQFFTLEAERSPGEPLRGTGCLFASAVAASLCTNKKGLAIETLQRAKDFVTEVIRYSHKKSPGGGLLLFPCEFTS